jgi:hypothetical protein
MSHKRRASRSSNIPLAKMMITEDGPDTRKCLLCNKKFEACRPNFNYTILADESNEQLDAYICMHCEEINNATLCRCAACDEPLQLGQPISKCQRVIDTGSSNPTGVSTTGPTRTVFMHDNCKPPNLRSCYCCSMVGFGNNKEKKLFVRCHQSGKNLCVWCHRSNCFQCDRDPAVVNAVTVVEQLAIQLQNRMNQRHWNPIRLCAATGNIGCAPEIMVILKSYKKTDISRIRLIELLESVIKRITGNPDDLSDHPAMAEGDRFVNIANKLCALFMPVFLRDEVTRAIISVHPTTREPFRIIPQNPLFEAYVQRYNIDVLKYQ